MEGDTPSFLYLLPNGLGGIEHPDWGSWGGRYGRLSPSLGLWTDAQDTATGRDGTAVTSNHATVWRWRRAFQNDFAARMAWTVTPRYEDANHPPDLVVNGIAGTAPIKIAACPGQVVPLSARGSRDPDGDALTLRWWWYREATGMHPPPLRILHAAGEDAQVFVDPWRKGDSPVVRFHVVLEATDAGTPALTRYRRVILSVPRDAAACPAAMPLPPAPRSAVARSGSAAR